MQYGHFDDAHKEYVIETPQTPLPWINYLGSDDFFTIVSNTAGGYSFYKDARLRRLTRYRYNASPLDADGLHIYIKDGGGAFGIPAGSPRKRRWRTTPAVTVWATRSSRAQKTEYAPRRRCSCPRAIAAFSSASRSKTRAQRKKR